MREAWRDLAASLGVGERHLRRLFVEHLGATPIAVAQSQRAHLAKMLVDDTAMPVTQIAFAAGYSSVRRFNTAFKAVFQNPPSRYRKGSARAAATHGSAPLRIRLRYRPPLDWQGLVEFFGTRAIPGVEEVVQNRYRRSVRFGKTTGVIEVGHDAERQQLVVEIPVALGKHVGAIVAGVRRMFDMGADPIAIEEQLGQDRLMEKLIAARPGLRCCARRVGTGRSGRRHPRPSR